MKSLSYDEALKAINEAPEGAGFYQVSPGGRSYLDYGLKNYWDSSESEWCWLYWGDVTGEVYPLSDLRNQLGIM